MQDLKHRLPQERNVSTAIPGPHSQELNATREADVAAGVILSLIHISEPTRLHKVSRMPSSA